MQDGPEWPSADAVTAPRRGDDPRSPDELLRDAWAIRRLREDLGEHEHDVRIRLAAERDRVQLAAARQWRAHGWRPITDARVPTPPHRTLLVLPAGAALVAAWASVVLGLFAVWTVAVLAAFATAPLLLERTGAGERAVRRWCGGAGTMLALVVLLAGGADGVLFLPAGATLLAVALLGPGPSRPGRARGAGRSTG